MTRTRSDYRKSITTQALRDELAAEAGAEYRIHCDIIDALERLRRPGVEFWHTPNGGKRTPVQGHRFKRMGVKAGVPDIIVSVPGAPPTMIFMEVKSKNGRLSKDQSDFMASMDQAGHRVLVARSLEQAVTGLEMFGAIRRTSQNKRAV